MNKGQQMVIKKLSLGEFH